jgi:hypothetical protein
VQRQRLPPIAADLGVVCDRVAGEQLLRPHQQSGRTETALEPVAVRERLLDRMEPALGARQRLDRLDGTAARLHGEQQARAGAPTVDEHRARTADALLAAEVRPGQPEIVSQEVGQRAP